MSTSKELPGKNSRAMLPLLVELEEKDAEIERLKEQLAQLKADAAGTPSNPEDPEDPGMSQMAIMIDALAIMDIEHVTVSDEAGATLDIEGGNRGTHGFSGLSVTFNFGPDEAFLFLSVVRG